MATPILRPGYRRGDGSLVNRDLSEFLVGRTIARIETGAMTEEGYAVTRLHFDDGDTMLLIPQFAEPAVTAMTGLRAAIRFVFTPGRPRRIITPGQAGF